MYLEFEPHSYYKGFAIKKRDVDNTGVTGDNREYPWSAYTDNGMTYNIVERNAYTLKELKQQITEYRDRENKKIAEAYKRIKELEATK